MLRGIIVGVVAGGAFLILDGVLNANPLAQQFYAPYHPIARPSVSAVAGSIIDLAYGVVLVFLFVTLRPSLPGQGILMKALSFGLIVWFLRVCMRVAGEWVVTTIPVQTHIYTLVAGLVQILIVAGIIALLLPEAQQAASV